MPGPLTIPDRPGYVEHASSYPILPEIKRPAQILEKIHSILESLKDRRDITVFTKNETSLAFNIKTPLGVTLNIHLFKESKGEHVSYLLEIQKRDGGSIEFIYIRNQLLEAIREAELLPQEKTSGTDEKLTAPQWSPKLSQIVKERVEEEFKLMPKEALAALDSATSMFGGSEAAAASRDATPSSTPEQDGSGYTAK